MDTVLDANSMNELVFGMSKGYSDKNLAIDLLTYSPIVARHLALF
jgi:hypothetical protein